jgi:hypothetical protein
VLIKFSFIFPSIKITEVLNVYILLHHNKTSFFFALTFSVSLGQKLTEEVKVRIKFQKLFIFPSPIPYLQNYDFTCFFTGVKLGLSL